MIFILHIKMALQFFNITAICFTGMKQWLCLSVCILYYYFCLFLRTTRLKNAIKIMESAVKKSNNSLQLTNNTPLRSVLWSTEFKRWVSEYIKTVSPNFLPQIKGIKTYRIIPSVKTCLNYLFPIVALTDTRKLKQKK